eukprot:m.46477 g.46477  ORF g.46477 m.46477 type:complete len:399 (-) comp12544_c0_seq1:321-1517(-)
MPSNTGAHALKRDRRSLWYLFCQPWAEEEDRKRLVVYARAFLALYGSIIFWIGAWDLITESRVLSARRSGELPRQHWEAIIHGRAREILCLVLGYLGVVLADTHYGNAGLSGTWWPISFYRIRSPALRFVVKALRLGVAVGSMLALWIGVYNVIEAYVLDNTRLRNYIFLGVGFVLLCATSTLYHFSFVLPAGEDEDVPSSRSPPMVHLSMTLRASISIVAQNLVWVGAYDLLEEEAAGWHRELFYWALGLMLILMTSITIEHSWIETEYKEAPPQHPSLMMLGRCILAAAGQVIHNTGFWTLLDDDFVFDPSPSRNAVYAVVGFLCLVASRSINNNFGISVPHDADDEGDAEYGDDEEEAAGVAGINADVDGKVNGRGGVGKMSSRGKPTSRTPLLQ